MNNKRHVAACLLMAIVLWPGATRSQGPEGDSSASRLNLDELLNANITAAMRYAQPVSEAPSAVSIITADDIAKFGFRTLDEALSSLPGMYTSYDRNYAYVGTRGFSRPTDYNDRILLLLNGMMLNDAVYGSAPLGTDFAIDLSAIERVELVTGPTSSLYGSNALFGVINVIPKDGATLDGIQAFIEGGSFGTIRAQAAYGKALENGLTFSLSGSVLQTKGQDLYFPEFDEPDKNQGVARGADGDRSAGAMLQAGWNQFRLQSSFLLREKHIPTAPYETAFNDPREKTRDLYANIELAYSPELSSTVRFEGRAYFYGYREDGWYPYDTFFETELSRSRSVGCEARILMDLVASNRLQIGAEYRRIPRSSYDLWEDGEWLLGFDNPHSLLSLYVQDQWDITSDLSLTIGARFDDHSSSPASFAPRGALVYHPLRQTTLKLLYGEAYRSPNSYELYYEDGLAAKANNNVRVESVRTYEAVLMQELSRGLVGAVSVFTYRLKDLIDQQIDPADSLYWFVNHAEMRSTGMDLSVRYKVRDWFSGFASYSFQRTIDPATGLRTTNSPAHIGRIGIAVDPVSHVTVAIMGSFESGRSTVLGTQTSPVALVHARLAYHTPIEGIAAALDIRNLFDSAYSYPGGFEHRQASILQDGRTLSLSLSYGL